MPVEIASILSHLPGFLVVISRIAGLFIFAPLLSSPAIPFQAKVLLVLTMGLTVYPTIAPTPLHEMPLDLYALAPLLAGELLIGAIMGLLAAMPLYAVQLAGLLAGQQIGLGLAQVVNPAIDIEGDNLGQILFLMALTLFMGLGGIEVLFGGVVHTFDSVSPGGFTPSDTPIDLVLSFLTAGFDLAIRLSFPVVAIIFVENAVMAFVMKTMPTLNVMSFGFPIRIVLGVFVLILSVGMMSSSVHAEIERTLEAIESWVASPRAEGAATAGASPEPMAGLRDAHPDSVERR